MPFTPINVVNGSTPANATWGNLVQTQYTEATLSFNPDLFTAFVLSGYTAAKDGSIANQLDVAAGDAYLLQSDGTARQRKLGSTTQTTATPSSTYHLYLQPDGTWYWSTSNAPAANSLAICNVTTDGSGNILVVTDQRTKTTRLLPGAGTNGMLSVPLLTGIGPIDTTGANQPFITSAADAHSGKGWSFYQMQDGSLLINEWTSGHSPIQLSPTGGIQALNGQATAGSFGAPVIVAQAVDFHVTTTALQTVLSYTPTAVGPYRVTVAIQLNNNVSGNKITAVLNWTDRTLGAGNTDSVQFVSPNGGASPATFLNGVTSILNGGIVTFQQTVMVAANQPMTVQYQDPTNTPNDFVTATIERLA